MYRRVYSAEEYKLSKLFLQFVTEIDQSETTESHVFNHFASESGICRAWQLWHSIEARDITRFAVVARRDITQNFTAASMESVISRECFCGQCGNVCKQQ